MPGGFVRHFAQKLNLMMSSKQLCFPEAWSASFLNDSCGFDVDDELPPELTDNPGTPRGTKLSVLQIILFPFGVNRGFLAADPLTGVSVGFRKACHAIGVLACPRGAARLRTDSNHERTLVPPRGCALLHLQSTLL